MEVIYFWTFLFLIIVFAFLYKHKAFVYKGLNKAIPQLPYLDEKETINFYSDVLNFKILSNWDGYIITKKDNIEIHLWKTDDKLIPQNTGCYIRIYNCIYNLYNDYASKKIIHENGKLEMKPWNMNQFSIIDNNGNIIHFGEEAHSKLIKIALNIFYVCFAIFLVALAYKLL